MRKDTHRVVIKTLASGSSGNATFLQFGDRRVLVDAGVSRRKLAKGLALVGVRLADLDALLITHGHRDHIAGLSKVLAGEFRGELMATPGAAREIEESLEMELPFRAVKAGVEESVGELSVTPFAIPHDAAEPVGYRFSYRGFELGYATDMGRVKKEVVEALKHCRVLMVEANYDQEMLRWGPYPRFLKQRIAGAGGHLSNAQSRALVEAARHEGLEQVVLLHLSEKNNQAHKAVEAVQSGVAKAVKVVAAPRKKAGETMGFEVLKQEQGEACGGGQLALF